MNCIAPVSAQKSAIKTCQKNNKGLRKIFTPLCLFLSGLQLRNIVKDEIKVSKSAANNLNAGATELFQMLKTQETNSMNLIKNLSKSKLLFCSALTIAMQLSLLILRKYNQTENISFAHKENFNSHQG